MSPKKTKRIYRIIDVDNDRHPFGLVDPDTDVVIRIDERPRYLADYAFDELGADEVRHDENLIRAEAHFRRDPE